MREDGKQRQAAARWQMQEFDTIDPAELVDLLQANDTLEDRQRLAEIISEHPPLTVHADKPAVVVDSPNDRIAGAFLCPSYRWYEGANVADPGVQLLTGARLVLFCSGEPRTAIVRRIKGSGAKLASGQESAIEAITGEEAAKGLSVVDLLRERGTEGTREAIRAIAEPAKDGADVPPWQETDVRARASLLQPITADATAEPPPSVLWAIDAEGQRHELATVGSLVSIRSQPGYGKTAIAWAAACSIEASSAGAAFDHTRTLGFGCSLSAALITDSENEAAALPRQLADTFAYRLQHADTAERIRLYSTKGAPPGAGLADYLAAASELNRQYGGGVLLILDRLSDFLQSDNDEQEVKASLRLLADWAAAERSVVVVIQHQKRNTTDGNGWTGSEVQRKVSASLLVERDKTSGISTIKADKLRRGDCDAFAVHFAFSASPGLFLWSGEAPTAPGSLQAAAQVAELVEAFGSEPFTTQQVADLWELKKGGTLKRLRALAPHLETVAERQGNKPAMFRVRKPSE